MNKVVGIIDVVILVNQNDKVVTSGVLDLSLSDHQAVFMIRGAPVLHFNEPAEGSCFATGLGLVWHCYCIFLTFNY